MSFGDVEVAIRNKLTLEWARPTVPILWANEVKVVPEPPFVIVTISGVREELAAVGGGLGANEWEGFGTITGHFHVHLLSGLALLRAIRDDFGRVFRGQRFSGVTCLGMTPFAEGKDPDKGNVYVATAVVDFTYRFRG